MFLHFFIYFCAGLSLSPSVCVRVCVCEHVCMLHATYMEVRGDWFSSFVMWDPSQVVRLDRKHFYPVGYLTRPEPGSPVPQNFFPHPPDIAPEGDSWTIYCRIWEPLGLELPGMTDRPGYYARV